MEEVKMFLFARWMATCYEGVLNQQDGNWWKSQLEHFTTEVYPNYLINGSVEATLDFLSDENSDANQH